MLLLGQEPRGVERGRDRLQLVAEEPEDELVDQPRLLDLGCMAAPGDDHLPDAEDLVGRKVVVVVNLQPRKLRGVESNGMIVAASSAPDGSPVLAGFLEDVPVGARLK